MKTIEQLAKHAETARARLDHIRALNMPVKLEDRIIARIEYEEAQKEMERTAMELEQAIRAEKSV